MLVTTPDEAKNETSHGQPWFLPDGRHFLSTAIAAPEVGRRALYVGSLDDASPVLVGESDSKALYASGFVLLIRNGTLLAQPFDAARLEVTGDPAVVTQDVAINIATGGAGFSASTTGVLTFRSSSGGGAELPSQLSWLNRKGELLGTVGEKTDQTELHLAPDGTRVAVSVLDPVRRSRDIWIHDFTRAGLRTRFTFDSGEDWSSAWSPDGRTLAFSGSRKQSLNIYVKMADGSATETVLLEAQDNVNRYVTSWSPDGRIVLYHTGNSGSQTGNDIWSVSLAGDGRPRALLQTSFNEADARFSPDGRWVAYVSNESGRNEIYVTPFPAGGVKWQISTAGGVQPRWRRDGRELFYLADNVMMVAAVNARGGAFEVGAVQRLFQVSRRLQSYNRPIVPGGTLGTGGVYDVAADGQRFLANVVADGQAALPPISVITNWTATLR